MARIVYVEDDDIVAELVKGILSRHGHFVALQNDGMLAYDMIGFQKPDLVILDWGLPGMGGLDILKALRRDGAPYRPPVLMLTAKSGEVAITEAMSSGADGYLVKPFAPEDLVETLEKILRRRSGS